MIGRLLCWMGVHDYRFFPVVLGNLVDYNIECNRCRQRDPKQLWETFR